MLFHMIISAWDWLVFAEKYHASQKIIHNSYNVNSYHVIYILINKFLTVLEVLPVFFQSFWILAQVINIVSSNIFHWKSVKESKVSMVFGTKFGPNQVQCYEKKTKKLEFQWGFFHILHEVHILKAKRQWLQKNLSEN